MATLLEQLNDEMASLVAGVGRSVVRIHNGRGGTGAGTIWHPQGLVLTNAHVAERHSPLVTLPDGTTLPARILASDPSRDLAALAVEATGLPTIPIGKSRGLRPGQMVLAMGYPWGVVGAVTVGVVVNVGSELAEAPWPGREWVVVNLHLRPGYSGGPLVDVQGRLVGINTMMTGPDVGLAVPVHVVKAFLRQALGARRAAA